MKNIRITVKYFGSIVDATNCDFEEFEVNTTSTVEHLNKLILSKYKPLKDAVYTLVCNKKIIQNNQPLKAKDEIALLPPFAGG